MIVNGALQDIKEVDEEERILEVARLIHRCTNHDLFPIMIFGGETRDIRIYHS